MIKPIALLLLSIFLLTHGFAQSQSPVASRMEDGEVVYYDSLHEAIADATGLSPENPDEIILLKDITVYEPIEISDAQHIRLVAGGGNRIIMRGNDFLDYPLIWVRGDYSSLHLGSPSYGSQLNVSGDLIIDGGYLAQPDSHSDSIEANAALIAVNGLGAKLIMYDGVFLQNNLNKSTVNINPFFQNGAGVIIRTRDDLSHDPAEFIMRAGRISGNINRVQNSPAYGAGVYISGYGIFSMEGGEISGNTAQRAGGGLYIFGTGSFRKTGGIIHGIDSPIALANRAMEGIGTNRTFGHAIFIGTGENMFRYRNDTVGEDDHLSFTGSPDGNGIYGEGEIWSSPRQTSSYYILIVILFMALLIVSGLIFYRKIRKQKQLNPASKQIIIPSNVKLSPREREVFSLFIEGKTAKQTAIELGLTISSINYYSESLYRKLGIQSRTELLVKYRG